MFKLLIAAPTMSELKSKIHEAYESIQIDSPADHLNDHIDDFGYDEEKNPAEEVPLPSAAAEIEVVNSDVVFPAEETSDDVELDSKGMPWDARIHAATKAKTAKGTWRYRRGVEDDVIAKVEGELKSRQSITAPSMAQKGNSEILRSETRGVASTFPQGSPMSPTLAVVPPPPPPTVATPPIPSLAVVPAQVAPTYENIPVPAAAQKPAHTYDTFKANLVMVLAGLMQSGAITHDYVKQLKDYFEVGEIWEIAKNEKQMRELFDNFVAAGLITKIG